MYFFIDHERRSQGAGSHAGYGIQCILHILRSFTRPYPQLFLYFTQDTLPAPNMAGGPPTSANNLFAGWYEFKSGIRRGDAVNCSWR